MLYNENEQEDLTQVLAVADAFVDGWGCDQIYVQQSKLKNALLGMRQKFPANGGLKQASAFKKCANFICFLVSDGPFLRPFPIENIGTELAEINNHQNAMIAFYIAVDALHNATIHQANGDKVVLTKKIILSEHSYIDIIEALATATPASHFHMVSVLLEQLCYRYNPDASYPPSI